jgi:hypothetical protein
MNTDYIPIPSGMGKKEQVPHAIAALILGIVSLANMAFFGWIPAIIGMNYAKKAQQLADENPGRFSESSIKMAQVGQKMSVYGLIFGILGMFVTGLYYYWILTNSMHHAYNYYSY